MKKLSVEMKEEIIRDLRMYYGEPPYDIEDIRRYRLSGLFVQQALAKYDSTPIEMIKAFQEVNLAGDKKEEAIKDIKMYFGEPPVPREMIDKRLSSGLLEMQILAKYSMTLNELIKEVGFGVAIK